LEDYAYILDYLPQGPPDVHKFKREPTAFGLGTNQFKILDLSPKPDAPINVGDKVYIGKDTELRQKIQHVRRRINYSDLTSTAQYELPYVIETVIGENEERFVKFFNEAQPLTTRFHILELLPGLGKKTLYAFIDERKKGEFKSLQDLSDRVPSMRQPEKLIVKRIELELSDPTQKYRIFALA